MVFKKIVFTLAACSVVPSAVIAHKNDILPEVAAVTADIPNLDSTVLNDGEKLHERGLQSGEKYDFCGFSWGRGNEGLLANVDTGVSTLSWDEFGDFEVVWDEAKGTLEFKGEVQPLPSNKYGTFPEGEMVMEVKMKYSKPVDYDQCYCASTYAPWVSNPLRPGYTQMQEDCRYQVYKNRPAAAKDLYFCPKCENRLCNKAENGFGSTGAPRPVYRDWIFYTKVEGEITGPGLELFRKVMIDTHPNVGLDPDLKKCTLDISLLPLPQFSCSNPSNPFDGYGYGANGKNQNCGFATWFKCKEDEDALPFPHIADFNLEILPCRTFEPTRSPTRSPTPKPTSQPTINNIPPSPDTGCCFWFGLNEQECDDVGGELGEFEHCVEEKEIRARQDN